MIERLDEFTGEVLRISWADQQRNTLNLRVALVSYWLDIGRPFAVIAAEFDSCASEARRCSTTLGAYDQDRDVIEALADEILGAVA